MSVRSEGKWPLFEKSGVPAQPKEKTSFCEQKEAKKLY